MTTILENCDYFVHMIKLPGSVGGILTPNDDNTYWMYLNSQHSGEMLIDDYTHEFEHIIYDDFYSSEPVADIERRRT